MRPLIHRKGRATIVCLVATCMAMGTVAAASPEPSVAREAAIDEYVYSPPGVGRGEIPANRPQQVVAEGPSERLGALAADAPDRASPSAALGSLAEAPPALPAGAALAGACLLGLLLLARRQGRARG